MNPFIERYKSLNNSDLLNIIENTQEYQTLAVEAAKTELANRNLSPEQLEEANTEIQLVNKEKEIKFERQRAFENKIRNVGSTLAETFNPIQKSELTTDNSIRLISIVFAGISIFKFYLAFRDIQHFIRYNYADCLEIFLSSITFILFPLATFQFWRRTRVGWILLSIILIYGCMTAIMNIVFAIHLQLLGFSGSNGLIRNIDPIAHMLTFVFYSATLWLITKQKMREIYNIEKDVMWRTIGISSGIMTLLLFSIFFN